MLDTHLWIQNKQKIINKSLVDKIFLYGIGCVQLHKLNVKD